MNQKTTLTTLALCALGCLGSAQAQNAEARYFNPVTTAVPSLQISPDARAAGMGDVGVSSTPDPYSQYWNPAKFAFIDSKAGVTMGYTPWLSRLVDGIALMQVGGYTKLGDEGNQAVGASLRYFTMGKLTKWGGDGMSLGELHPNEFAIDASYARKLSSDFSLAVALRYIHSDQGNRDEGAQPGSAFAADIAGYHQTHVALNDVECLWTNGFNLRNIGTKISFDGGATSAFIPANLGLGTGLAYPIDEENVISVNIEANKLLVPTPPKPLVPTPSVATEDAQRYQKTSAIAGIFKSFADAPGGFSEEFKEIRWGLGAEYNYGDKFFVRAGYSYLHPEKGNLQFFTAGAGFRMSAFRIDASYLVSTIADNPLDQTLRFTLAFDMDGIRGLLK